MKLLINKDNIALTYGVDIQKKESPDEPSILKWKITEGLYELDFGQQVIDIDETMIPEDFEPYKYIYKDREFTEYTSPEAKTSKSLEELHAENEQLKTQVEIHALDQAETELDIDERLCNLELGLA